MKLEDVKLEIGDKITYRHKLEGDISFEYVNLKHLNDEYWDEEYAEILKIERYIKHEEDELLENNNFTRRT